MPSGNAIKKKDLIRSHFVYWPSLLVGVWHFIVTKRKDNTIGAATVRDMEAGVAAWTNHSFLDGITGPIKREYIFDLGDVRRPSKEEDDDEEYLTHSLPTENYTEYLASIIKRMPIRSTSSTYVIVSFRCSALRLMGVQALCGGT